METPISGKMKDEMLSRLSQGGRRGRLRFAGKLWAWKAATGLARVLKRTLDVAASLAAMVLLFPVFALTALAIVLENPGPVFYTQVRVGQNGKHFRFYKFRSMIANADRIKSSLSGQNESRDGVIFKMKKDPRITRVGRIIRKFSIDELPQLANVLKGDMSLVGPRPPLPQEVSSYTLEQRKRLHVRPGITCFWQVSGRSDIPFTDQVRLDLQYIQSTGILTDLVILLKTIPAVLTGKGAY